MNQAYWKDIWRTIVRSKKRYISIMIITMLGVTMLTGLKAGCVDLRNSADAFYDQQNLYDIQVVSTMGLTKADVEALQSIEGISLVEGSYEESMYLKQDETQQSIALKTLSKQGINEPYVIEGVLPNKENEIAVSQKYYIENTGKKLQDRVSLQVDGNSTLKQSEFIITAIVQDASNISVQEGMVSFRSISSVDDTFFVSKDAYADTIYTSIYLTLQDTKKMNCYRKEYEERVKAVVSDIEKHVKPQREQARYDEIRKEIFGNRNAQQEAIETQQDFKLPEVKWYVQDRTALSSYTSVESDASSIETVGNAFPIVFLIVAILISLTTITRMVEEERGLIGTYKALGFSDCSIYGKYLIYAFSACLIGGILGDICGFILLPKFLFTIFQVLYELPFYEISFDVAYGLGGVLLFVVGIVIATLIACRVELKQMPAVLMRPKAPKAGSRVILEYIPAVWRRLSFLNKVTMRNLFRFKKRMFMTIGGIMGCTALILCGFAIKDSVTELMPGQYERIYQYEFMSVVSEASYEEMEQVLKQDDQIADMIGVRVDSIKVKSSKDGQEETMQLMVIPDDQSINGYLGLEDLDGNSLQLNDGIYITQNASQVLGFDQGDTIIIQDLNLVQQEVKVDQIVQNYLGNAIYMTQKEYERLFQAYEPNGFLAHFSNTCMDQPQYAQEFSKQDGVVSSISVQQLKEQFSEAFSLINAVVYLITIMAAGLAFVVLFTLSTTNISERQRELATIKVLGFFDHEVHLYVHKETLILTLIGILCGLPLGYVLSGMLTSALNMPSIHFAVSVYPISYVYAALLSLCFALIVTIMSNRMLNQINMVEALKSVE